MSGHQTCGNGFRLTWKNTVYYTQAVFIALLFNADNLILEGQDPGIKCDRKLKLSRKQK